MPGGPPIRGARDRQAEIVAQGRAFVVFAVDMAVLRISLVDGWRGRNELFRVYSSATVDNSQTMRIDPLFHSGEQFVLDAEGRRRRDLSQRIALARY